MGERPETALYFNEVASIEDRAYLGGHLYIWEGTDAEFTRIAAVRNQDWVHLGDMDAIAWSMCAYHVTGGRVLSVLSRDGSVVTFSGVERREQQIENERNYLFQIARIEDTLYCCGGGGRVFREEGGAWAPHDDGLVPDDAEERASAAWFGIAGTSESDIYCVGNRGAIAHFDGERWTRIDSPTNRSLERVLCRESGEVIACGREGTVLRGRGGEWAAIGDPSYTEHFWGVAEYRNEVYICSDPDLWVIRDTELVPVDTGLPEASFYRLSATEEYLWATSGRDQVYRFDGREWIVLTSPDNE